MELGEGLAAHIKELEQRFPGMTQRVAAIAEGATLRAIEAATELTPPNTFEDGEQRGVNMISGEMAQHWATDSSTSPVGAEFTTILANNVEYASYVDQGHYVKKRFVPGLYVDPKTGLLSYDLEKKDKRGKRVGMMVGTKTTEVKGLYITDKAKEKYGEVVEIEFKKLLKEMQQL